MRPPAHPNKRYFDYLPIGLFGSVMGLAGLSLAWRLAAARFAAPGWIAETIGTGAALTFAALALAYGAKAMSAPDSVRAEFAHPITRNLFGMVLICLLLMAAVAAPFKLVIARAMWFLGTAGVIGFALLVINRWTRDRQQVDHATPAWLVPIVGLLNVPLAVPSLALPEVQLLLIACIAIGLFFAIALFAIIFARLLFGEPLPVALQPTLLILVAPFAVGFSAYVAATGHVDLFAEALYAMTIFILAALIGRMRHLALCCPFRLAWWGVSFPLAASATAAFRLSIARPGVATDGIAILLLGLASLVIAALVVRTILGIARGELETLSS